MGSHEGSHGVTWTKVAPQFGLKVSQKVAPQKKAAECSVLAQAPILLLRSTSLSLLPAAQAAERKFCHEPLASLRPRTSGITCTLGLLRNLSSVTVTYRVPGFPGPCKTSLAVSRFFVRNFLGDLPEACRVSRGNPLLRNLPPLMLPRALCAGERNCNETFSPGGIPIKNYLQVSQARSSPFSEDLPKLSGSRLLAGMNCVAVVSTSDGRLQ